MRGHAAPSRLRLRVLHEIRAHRLWQPADRVAVAVSGGLDSVALLHLLLETKQGHGGALEVVTVDHRSRASSGADAGFVWGLARTLELPVSRIDLGPTPHTEAAWREARYRALDAHTADVVVTAHHGDDLAETVLLQLIRGVPSAPAPMGWRRGRYVRPLLTSTRAELRAYAEARGLVWREDPSNVDPRHLRTRIRREALPLLESIRPGAAVVIAREALRRV